MRRTSLQIFSRRYDSLPQASDTRIYSPGMLGWDARLDFADGRALGERDLRICLIGGDTVCSMHVHAFLVEQAHVALSPFSQRCFPFGSLCM